jgi:hypothetical protein
MKKFIWNHWGKDSEMPQFPNGGNDVRNRLVVDVFYDNGQEFIQFTKVKEILVETAWRWEWERVLEYTSS